VARDVVFHLHWVNALFLGARTEAEARGGPSGS
jgi:hypothetical protein